MRNAKHYICCGQLWVRHMICHQTCDGLYHFAFCLINFGTPFGSQLIKSALQGFLTFLTEQFLYAGLVGSIIYADLYGSIKIRLTLLIPMPIYKDLCGSMRIYTGPILINKDLHRSIKIKIDRNRSA